MIALLARKLGWLLFTLWVVFTFSFFLMRSAPGGPFSKEREPPEAIKRNIEARYNLDLSLTEQYFLELGRALRGDLGLSFKLADFSVKEVIAQGFPVSASLGIFALMFALLVGLPAGVISATRRGTLADVTSMTLATLGIAIPNFVLASLAIILLVFVFPIFPAGGWGSVWQLILPAICLGAPYAAYIARLTRTGMLDVLSQDYIRTAHAKGLPESRVIFRHALRGALLPVVSFMGPATAGVLTGSLVVERIFAISGMGRHFIEAAIQRDYTLAMGMILVYTFLLYTMNVLVDISYGLIDPRVKMK